MQLNTIPRHLVSAGAVGALALSGLMFAPAAQAAPATTAYECGIAGVAGPYDVSIVTDLPGLPTAGINAGMAVPADLLGLTNKVTVPTAAYRTIGALGYTTIGVPDFALTVGNETVGASGLAVPATAFVASADGTTYTADVNGKNAAFNAPATGTHAVTTPTAFSLNAAKADGSSIDIPCTIKAGTAVGTVETITTAANASTVKAKAKKTKAGKKAKVKVVVAADNVVPSGKIIAKIGSKKVAKGALNAKGKVVLKIKPKALKAGKNKLKLSYVGDDYVAKSKSKVVVKVTR